MRWLTSHLKAHALIFDPEPRPSYAPAAGLRLLAVFVLLEGVIGPRQALLTFIGLPPLAMWVRVPLQLTAALLLIRFAASVRLREIGLYGWRCWSASEKAYLQMIPLALVIFAVVTAGRLRALADSGLTPAAALTLISEVAWGFYQEVMYRGILQTELVRRWGVAPGILVSNTAYTFGPLHVYYWSTYQASQVWTMFGLVFAIGLFFALLFHRSGNLWLPAVLHGIGDVFLTGLGSFRR